jgi:hypothetical protein
MKGVPKTGIVNTAFEIKIKAKIQLKSGFLSLVINKKMPEYMSKPAF